jgi:hypothetical protein
MNTVEKELMAQRIMENISKTLLTRNTPPIILKWRQDLTDSDQEGTEAEEELKVEVANAVNNNGW